MRPIWTAIVEAWTRLARRVFLCPLGHRYFFSTTPTGLLLVCPRCLTTHHVAALPGKDSHGH